jgi:class 3 adenylate cyclase
MRKYFDLNLLEEFPAALPVELHDARFRRLHISLMIAFCLRYLYVLPCLFIFPYLFDFSSKAYTLFFLFHLLLNTIALLWTVRTEIAPNYVYYFLIITDYIATIFVSVVISSTSPIITVLLITTNTALLGTKKLSVATLLTFVIAYILMAMNNYNFHLVPTHFDLDPKFAKLNYLLFDVSFVCLSNIAVTFAIIFLKIQGEQSEYMAFLNKQEIDVERQKSDKLILNILPVEIAHELKIRGAAEPRFHPECTVLFTDFVGFTQIAESMSPQELVLELDRSFSYFDQVAKHHKLEKLKTIGDSYMAATGIPGTNHSHAIDMVLAALEIRDFMSAMKGIKTDQGLPYWELRIGIHSGPLVAGVVGESKFAYDVWGDTVNLASRLESSGVPGKINISTETYKRIKYFFVCEHRGKIAAKRKGDIDMYFVHGLKKSMSVDGDGKTPNPRMLDYCKQINTGKTLKYRSEL